MKLIKNKNNIKAGSTQGTGLFHRLRRSRDGVTVVEFALVSPVFLMLLMGIFDLGYNVYVRALLDGAMQKAARDATLESGATSTEDLDEKVRNLVGTLGSNVSITFERENFMDFTDSRRAEEYSDDNGNGKRDKGECYIDENNNNRYDLSVGQSGVGGARDVVPYTATASYRRLFPVSGLIGLDPDATVQAKTILRNQPYSSQAARDQSSIKRCN